MAGQAPTEILMDRTVLRLTPQEEPAQRGGIVAEPLVPFNATSEAYAGQPGANSVVFEVRAPADTMIDLSRSFVETQFFVELEHEAAPGVWNAPVATERCGLKNGASALMWNRVNLRVNDSDVSDGCHEEAGPGPAVASFFDVMENKNSPFGTYSRGKVWQPEDPTPNAANASYGSVSAITPAPAISTAIVLMTGLVGSDSGQASQLGGWAFASQPFDTRASDDAATVNSGAHGENEVKTMSSERFSQLLPILGNTAADPASLLYKPAMSLFTQPTPLPMGSKVRLELFKNDVENFVQSEFTTANGAGQNIRDMRVTYVRCRFWVSMIQLQPVAINYISEYLASAPYTYNFIVRRMFSDTLAVGTSNYQKGGILQGPMPSRLYLFMSRGLYPTTVSNGARCSPWAMSSKSWISAHDAGGGNDTRYATLNMPEIAELYVRVGSQQYPREPYRSTVGGRADSFRAYMTYVQAARKSLIAGDNQPVLSYSAFMGNYTFYTIDLLADPSNGIATTVSSATSALASTSGLEVYIQLKAAVAATGANYDSDDVRLCIVSESAGSLEISGTGGVTKLGY